MKLGKFKLFGLSFLCALLVTLAVLYHNRTRPEVVEWNKAQRFAEGIFVSEQVTESDMGAIARQGFATVIDLRPDGEATDQPSSATIERTARASGLSFFYVPVQHGAIPDSSVTALGDAVAKSKTPVLVYCRSGKRAARTLGLMEASRAGGPDAAAILAMVRGVGQSADDLSGEINERIAKRKTSEVAR